MFNKYDVYTEIESLYCYKDSHVLYNKFKIKDYNKLKEIETDITALKLYRLSLSPANGHFTSSHLCNIHRYIFEDIYRFAGHFRRETIKKGDTTFLSEKEIPFQLKILLKQLKEEKYLSAYDHHTFIKRLAHFFAELNYIHPFREGNGRAIREFIR